MDTQALNEFIVKKKLRQQTLLNRKKNLEDLDLELSGAKFGRAFRTMYYYFKRFLSLILGFFFLIGALTFLFKPDVVFLDAELKEILKEGYFAKFEITAGESIESAAYNLILSNQEIDAASFLGAVEDSFNIYLEKEILFLVKLIGVLLLFIALSLMYVSRLSKQLRRRNSSISKADSLTQKIIHDYKLTIEEEEKELGILTEVFQTNSN